MCFIVLCDLVVVVFLELFRRTQNGRLLKDGGGQSETLRNDVRSNVHRLFHLPGGLVKNGSGNGTNVITSASWGRAGIVEEHDSGFVHEEAA